MKRWLKIILIIVGILIVVYAAILIMVYYSDAGKLSRKLAAQPDGAIVTLTPKETSALMDQFMKARNKYRSEDIAALQGALEKYFSTNKKYPESLGELAPNYIDKNKRLGTGQSYDRLDPTTDQPYEYKVLPGAQNYELCVTFEPNDRQCTSHNYNF